MADEDIFDPNMLKKKKKKKKVPFDVEAALADAEGTTTEEVAVDDPAKVKEEKKEEKDLDDLDLDMDFTTAKKKKSKKAFNMDELEDAMPEKEKTVKKVEKEDDFSSDMDFSKMKKKKKKGAKLEKILLDEAVDEEGADEEVDENVPVWLTSDRDYTYDELLNRVFDIMKEKNPDIVAGSKRKFVMRPPQVLRVGTKKTSFANFAEICKMLHRQPKHLLQFALAELGTSGSVDGNNQLIMKGRFQQKHIENVLRRYIKEYVTCHTCRSPDTILQKDTRLFFLNCETCGSRCSVASIKSGYQAVTGKRAAQRAKTQ